MNIRTFTLIAVSCFLLGIESSLAQQSVTYSNLKQGQVIQGFKVKAVYLNDSNIPMGGRFIDVSTGFTLDLLQIESVPQSFVWVNTYPASDKGEPHTQEHLLITKGNKGRGINTRADMSLAESNAFTNQTHTVYNFNTGGGADVFYTLFDKYLDALLYPDYTNEEVNREVRNWGITVNADKTFRLEEKGSVYNEMTTGMDNPYSLMFDRLGRMLYGKAHPLSYNAGGLPASLRIITPNDIADYHNNNYYLGNMGAINSLPSGMKLDDVLKQMAKTLRSLDKPSQHLAHASRKLPPAHPEAPGLMHVIPFPSDNAAQPGSMLLAYPGNFDIAAEQYIELSNFMSVFAGDATTNLYKIFVDSKTRQAGLETQSVYGYVDDGEGHVPYFGLEGIKTEDLTVEKIAMVRQRIIDELNRVASFKDHSPELLEFNKRFENSLASLVRNYAKFINSPPKFGFRNTGDSWYSQLKLLNNTTDFKKSINLKPQIAAIKRRLASGTNIWKADIASWGLNTTLPYGVVSKASTDLQKLEEKERGERSSAEVSRLKTLYHLNDDQEAIKRYKADYDANTEALEKLEQNQHIKFIDHPPLTLDDELNYKQTLVNGHIPMVASVFNNMTSATAGVALNLNNVPKEKLVYLALLPELLTQTGIIKNGKSISYEDMIQLEQQEILKLDLHFSTSENTGRAELVAEGSGNNEAEALRAVGWINDVLKHPNWTTANLSRLRDLVEQSLSGIRKRMQDREETWVNDPSRAYRTQQNPLLLSTASFLTREHHIFRLKWMLKDAETDASIINNFFTTLSNAAGNRQQLSNLINTLESGTNKPSDSVGANKNIVSTFIELPPIAKQLAKEAAADLQQTLVEIPDGSLNADWKYLCLTMQHDLAQTPDKTLKDLNDLRASLLNVNNARLYMIGSEATEAKLNAGLKNLLNDFNKEIPSKQSYPNHQYINERVMNRMATNETPIFAGLVNPDSHTGVFINSVPLVGYDDLKRDQLLTILAAQLYGGGGKQSVYTKTTGAGLSYSTGVSASPRSGKFRYYAERTPELPQTLRFVINEIKKSPVDTSMLDYLVSLIVGDFRSAEDYEVRGAAMAIDLADGNTPDRVKRFRQAILKLRKEPGVINEIYKYKDIAYEKILPGYGIAGKNVAGASYFVIGDEKQMIAYENYLKTTSNGPNTKLFRFYPRDFWVVDK
jgi:Zn-dependent M16 (insulinase) family peptidase